MSTEGNLYETIDFGHRDNPTPCYDNATSRYEQALPEMDTTQPTFYPPPPAYAEVPPELQLEGMVNPPPYHINNPSEGAFSRPMVIPSSGWTHPQEVGISLPQPNNNQKMFQKPPPMYNPGFLKSQISKATVPDAVFPSPPHTMIPGIMPPLQYPHNCPVPGTVIVNTVQPMVVTTQTTVISTQTPPYKDYLVWSILNLIFCCLIFGIVALIFSLQTQSSKKHQDWESAKKYSCVALGFNVAAMLLGIVVVIVIIALSLH